MKACYFCLGAIREDDELEHHHPEPEQFPDWTEPAHRDCHRSFHARQNGPHSNPPAAWRGRPGYEETIKVFPGFHRAGGLARAKAGKRDKKGRYI